MTILRRISREELTQFYHDYYHGVGVSPATARLGQAFLNRFYPALSDWELFYQKDDAKAAEMIEKHYTVQAVAA